MYSYGGELSRLDVRRVLEEAARSLFGECGAGSLDVDVLRCAQGRALLRLRPGQLRRARAAIALAAPALTTVAMSARTELAAGAQHAVVVAARAELAAPSRVTLPEPEPAPGLILADGSINWGCPCLGGMATGPCGPQFRDAFSCFHYSDAEPKGGDCYDKFSTMQECMAQYPELYGRDDDDELASALDEAAAATAAPERSAAAAPAAATPPSADK